MIQNNFAIKIYHNTCICIIPQFTLWFATEKLYNLLFYKKKTHILFDIFHQDNPLNQIWIQFSQQGKIHFASPENTSEIYGVKHSYVHEIIRWDMVDKKKKWLNQYSSSFNIIDYSICLHAILPPLCILIFYILNVITCKISTKRPIIFNNYFNLS